jgi:hypothetical protein
VGAFGCGPAPQQDVHADAKIDQRDQPQSGIERAICGSENQRRFQRNTLTNKRVGRLRPDAHAVNLALQSADIGYVVVLHCNQQVTRLDARFLAGSVDIHALGTQMSAFFHPPNAIVRRGIFAVFLKINAGQNDGGYAKQRQENREKACL